VGRCQPPLPNHLRRKSPRATLATNVVRSAATDGSGSYRITRLLPGSYDVLVERVGFNTVEYSRVELTVCQVENLSPTLVPSATPETITVHGDEACSGVSFVAVGLHDFSSSLIGSLGLSSPPNTHQTLPELVLPRPPRSEVLKTNSFDSAPNPGPRTARQFSGGTQIAQARKENSYGDY